MPREIIAAIDVGSHAMRMKIGELKSNGEFRELESFRRGVALGHDTFTNSKISFDSVDKVCSILKIFKNTMNDYGIKIYKAFATSALREASNKAYIIDQIKLKTGINITAIDNSEEQYLTYKAVKYKLENYETMINEGAVIVVIGAGSIQVTMYKDGKLISSQNVKMGALRIKEVLGSLENETLKYNKILDEYITVNFEGLDFFDKNLPYKHFIAVGGEISVIKKMIATESVVQEVVTKQQFDELFDDLIRKSPEEIENEYCIKRERSEILVPSMMLFKKFMDQTNLEIIVVPIISLTDGIIRDIYDDVMNPNKKDKATEDIVSNAKVIAEKFNYNKTHSEHVEKIALLLFDKLKKLHGLENERILLRMAAIMHDIGKFVELDQHHLRSYEIIRSLEIIGISKEQMLLIANIAKYHSIDVPTDLSVDFKNITDKNSVLIAKLAAILRIADALDRSHLQKLEIQQIKVKDRELIIRAVTDKNTTLEEWTFAGKASFFKEVFGITPLLKIKKEYE